MIFNVNYREFGSLIIINYFLNTDYTDCTDYSEYTDCFF